MSEGDFLLYIAQVLLGNGLKLFGTYKRRSDKKTPWPTLNQPTQ